MDKKGIEKSVNIFLANGFLKAGQLEEAQRIYEEESAKIPANMFLWCGDACVKNEQYKAALEAYELAGIAWMTKERYIKLGDLCIKKAAEIPASRNCLLGIARKAYEGALANTKAIK